MSDEDWPGTEKIIMSLSTTSPQTLSKSSKHCVLWKSLLKKKCPSSTWGECEQFLVLLLPSSSAAFLLSWVFLRRFLSSHKRSRRFFLSIQQQQDNNSSIITKPSTQQETYEPSDEPTSPVLIRWRAEWPDGNPLYEPGAALIVAESLECCDQRPKTKRASLLHQQSFHICCCAYCCSPDALDHLSRLVFLSSESPDGVCHILWSPGKCYRQGDRYLDRRPAFKSSSSTTPTTIPNEQQLYEDQSPHAINRCFNFDCTRSYSTSEEVGAGYRSVGCQINKWCMLSFGEHQHEPQELSTISTRSETGIGNISWKAS